VSSQRVVSLPPFDEIAAATAADLVVSRRKHRRCVFWIVLVSRDLAANERTEERFPATIEKVFLAASVVCVVPAVALEKIATLRAEHFVVEHGPRCASEAAYRVCAGSSRGRCICQVDLNGAVGAVVGPVYEQTLDVGLLYAIAIKALLLRDEVGRLCVDIVLHVDGAAKEPNRHRLTDPYGDGQRAVAVFLC
jgi:hypothetical protein